jgi:hypothetical protein
LGISGSTVVKLHEHYRLHIDALLLDPFYGVQGKFLKKFGTNHEWTRIGTNNWQRTAPRIRRLVSSGKSEAITGSLM